MTNWGDSFDTRVDLAIEAEPVIRKKKKEKKYYRYIARPVKVCGSCLTKSIWEITDHDPCSYTICGCECRFP